MGTDALRILLISQEPSDGEERNQDNEDIQTALSAIAACSHRRTADNKGRCTWVGGMSRAPSRFHSVTLS